MKNELKRSGELTSAVKMATSGLGILVSNFRQFFLQIMNAKIQLTFVLLTIVLLEFNQRTRFAIIFIV